MSSEIVISGIIIHGRDFTVERGDLIIEDGKIKRIERSNTSEKNIIAPSFVNAHTHIGDSVLKDPPFMSLDDFIHLKHETLRETTRDMIIEAMRGTISDMLTTGTTAFADFREGGLDGITALKEATHGINAIIFGRPGNDIEDILPLVHGIGMSGVNDYPWDYLCEIREKTRKHGKPFAIHAGEKDRTDITGAIELEPDFLVHLTNASTRDLRIISDERIGVVICPRSNLVTNTGMPPLREMHRLNITIGVGTDNVMLNSSDMFSEMEFISKLLLHDDDATLKLCTIGSSDCLGIDENYIEENKPANLLVLNGNSPNLRNTKNPIAAIARRARPDDLLATVSNGEITRFSHQILA